MTDREMGSGVQEKGRPSRVVWPAVQHLGWDRGWGWRGVGLGLGLGMGWGMGWDWDWGWGWDWG